MSSKQHGGESLIAILDQILDTVSTARSMPMSASVLVNKAELVELINSAKEVVPSQISKADSLIAHADQVLEEANQNSEKLITQARERAEQLISQEAVVTQAKERAKEIVAQAEEKAEKLMHDADLYCDGRLAEFEIDLGKITQQVAAGRARLEERIHAGAKEDA